MHRNQVFEGVTFLAKSGDGEEKLCVDKQGGFLVCDAYGEILYQIGWNEALELAELWDADPELVNQYFGDESGAMALPE